MAFGHWEYTSGFPKESSQHFNIDYVIHKQREKERERIDKHKEKINNEKDALQIFVSKCHMKEKM